MTEEERLAILKVIYHEYKDDGNKGSLWFGPWTFNKLVEARQRIAELEQQLRDTEECNSEHNCGLAASALPDPPEPEGK